MTKVRSRRIPSFLKTVSTHGSSPGSLKHVGEKKTTKPHITLWTYNEKTVEEVELQSIEEYGKHKRKDAVCWMNIDGLHDAHLIEAVGKEFNLHSLLLEDILNTTQHPKIEEYDDAIFVVVKMLHFDEKHDHVFVEQLSLVLKENCVLSFQEEPQDYFDHIRDRLRSGMGKLRSGGADYLVYRLLDSTVDAYFTVLEQLGETIEDMEQQFIENPDDAFIGSIYDMRREMLFVRKAIYPLRDVVLQIQQLASPLMQESTRPFLRDAYDHIIQSTETVDTFRDLLGNMLDNYLSIMSHRTNDVMKVLTIIATIFIPLTFIAGVYGMNFRHMPELQWEWGYPAVLCVMAAVGLGMLLWLKKRKWL
ncbi:magnesium and cobalt transport protein CorA [Candidatus Peregrinibacteria bacterium CG10_big_fil_rev_8_21_14_0_10_49_10]|nr:MAG: magnesium and cobalt transport protein CorA [Candidatus Peregrinibacteria bacterium CG10_big_fil_rev_8_21_14_0_10_49_10]